MLTARSYLKHNRTGHTRTQTLRLVQNGSRASTITTDTPPTIWTCVVLGRQRTTATNNDHAQNRFDSKESDVKEGNMSEVYR
jgi:sugar/nucleoside kinase (ribokinase family)